MPAPSTATSGSVITVVTNSTRAITGTGLKKWRPTTLPGRFVADASRVIGIDEVLEARMASGSATTASRSVKICLFKPSSSVAASITSCRSDWSERSVETVIRADTASRSVASSFPLSTALAIEESMRPNAPSAAEASISWITTWLPLRAKTSAMPDPISPPPMTPTRSGLMGGW